VNICGKQITAMNQLIKPFVILLFIVNLFSACSKNEYKPGIVEKQSGEVILKWNEIAYEAFGGTTYQHSLMASRINAMMHIAMHDAVNGIQPKYETYVFTGKDADANPIAAAAAAAHEVLVNQIPGKKDFLDSSFTVILAGIADGDAKLRGISLGKLAAIAIIADRNNDGSGGEVFGAIPPSTVPGVYQAVPPFDILFAPDWDKVKLFSLQSKDQFRPDAHPALNSQEYAEDFNEVKETGQLNSVTRTADQTAYAKFWYEFSEAGWNRVARTVAVNKNLNLLEAARLFALVDMAIADAYTAGWDAKLHYNFWRPYTAIRNAQTDGNDNTIADTEWLSAEGNPPVQDYPSTHSALGNAGAAVLARILGDNTSFSMSSPTAFPAGTFRTFNSFSQAAYENADSRVRAGIHFRFSCEEGLDLGKKIGDWTVDNHLKKLN
jgi:hypothetical protein